MKRERYSALSFSVVQFISIEGFCMISVFKKLTTMSLGTSENILNTNPCNTLMGNNI
ncbi:hypothetical protein LX92_03042 [Maribacter polysiphoniae]|uniref:Uncharacterized protein n=1 Tax=Maribacter polysiphoniae TaxID=429344 RepID=A0A316DW28_9FLAO|nr:hypothetical protein LX92_03042 [Maribacter polysiphoniae]